ncbi:hypothetical protein E2P81_ATG00161 [Venturia nashicola]|uniref:Uncharacterized protein n=1 Tax=Venturia nashicola TaxID=86259 RepID=A0A4Z1PD06_9PEZI|nr:hypothetical protein E6O75_ATG00168 [Venturia nashicola]TLD39174.1 hypothetical protein E2P81_ATG00161 [Venturia nashicola]
MARTHAPRDCEPSSSDAESLLSLEAEADEHYPFDGQLIDMGFGDDIEDSFALQRAQWDNLERRSSTLLKSQQSTTPASRNNKKRAGSPISRWSRHYSLDLGHDRDAAVMKRF